MFTTEEIKSIVAECAFPGLDGDRWEFLVGNDEGRDFLQIECFGKCNVTGVDLSWKSRKWLLSPHMCKSEIVRTIHKMVINAVTHEVNEKFTYKGKRIYDPHLDIDALAEIAGRLDVRTPPPQTSDELFINGKKMKFPGRVVTYERLVELAGMTGNPSMVWTRKSDGNIQTSGMLYAGVSLGLWGKVNVTCVHTNNA